MASLWQLFSVFARMGAVTFGGGYAIAPILQAEVVNKYHWATDEELADYYAVGQCTPGVIAVNTATFIGMKARGVAGALAATLGVIFPSMVIITTIAAFLSNFAHIPAVADAFAGIRVGVCILIFQAVRKLFCKGRRGQTDRCTFFLVLIINVITDISPAYLVVAAGLVGIAAKERTVTHDASLSPVHRVFQDWPICDRRRHGYHPVLNETR